jgi:hypothetical protein
VSPGYISGETQALEPFETIFFASGMLSASIPEPTIEQAMEALQLGSALILSIVY